MGTLFRCCLETSRPGPRNDNNVSISVQAFFTLFVSLTTMLPTLAAFSIRIKPQHLKAKFHYASWFEAGSKLVADRFEAKFHYAIWFEAGSKMVADRFRQEPDNVMEFGFNNNWSKYFDIRPHRRRIRTSQSYLLGIANVHLHRIMLP